MMPAHKKLKYRKGHGDKIETNDELKRRLLEQEEEYAEGKQDLKRIKLDEKRYRANDNDNDNETEEERKIRILKEAEDIDRDDEDEENLQEEDDEEDVEESQDEEESEDDGDDNDDDDELLMLELAKIKRERAEEEERKLAKAKAKEAQQLVADFSVKKSWTDDVAFRNQAKGVDELRKGREGEFVNDMLRTEFHKKFLNKYVR
ncbi:hypothetical protein TRVA0_021S01904 [Trichomonascus vanleenenianus]|uniref:U2-type spliceosomal complex subunit CWC15 n=1 Tax=Trichomonascus vanleenenianus TaxID=2268995 RepID=UPI003ECA9A01